MSRKHPKITVIPAQAGIQKTHNNTPLSSHWIPAYAGMTT
jgi:hypothetical protein